VNFRQLIPRSGVQTGLHKVTPFIPENLFRRAIIVSLARDTTQSQSKRRLRVSRNKHHQANLNHPCNLQLSTEG